MPRYALRPCEPFEESFWATVRLGERAASEANLAIVGLARNCAGPLAANLDACESLGAAFAGWVLHVETNDNTDETISVLDAFCEKHPGEASYRNRLLGRKQYTTEFAGPRTEALAEYRAACQGFVRKHAWASDIVIAIDFDLWGGFLKEGVMHAVGELYRDQSIYGAASVSLFQYRDPSQEKPQWVHYDCWALRLNSYWDDYTAGLGAWKHQWLPLLGSPVVPVCSAFGGLAAYRCEDFLKGRYSGEDCEHVPFHRSIAEQTGKRLVLDPAMRTVVSWETWQEAESHGGGNGHDRSAGVSP